MDPDVKALAELADVAEPFKVLFQHGSLEVEIYKPDKVDLQQPHTRDEIYVIASGSGQFVNGDQQHPVEPGDHVAEPSAGGRHCGGSQPWSMNA